MNCEYCKKTFSNKGNLQKHQNTTKFCLKLQQATKFICLSCQKELSTKQWLLNHYLSCEKYKISKEEERKQETTKVLTENYEKETLLLKERIKEQQEHIKELENKLENIALSAITRPTTINKTYINNLQPVTDQRFEECVPNFSLEYAERGSGGYAEFALEHPLKDSVVCSDYARRKVEYKTSDGAVKVDPEMTFLATKFFQSIEMKNKEILKKHCYENFNEDEAEKFQEYIASVCKGSQGEKSNFYHDFVKEVCSRTVKDLIPAE